MKFIPQSGKELTISLPGEMLRASVLKVITADAIIARIITEPLARLSHSYRNGQVIACRRKQNMFGEEWEVVQQTFSSVEELEEQERKNAAQVRKQQKSDKPQHKGIGKKREPAKKPQANRGNRTGQRKKASKGK